MNRSLREMLADSHVAAIAIVLLLLWSIDWGFRSVLILVSSVGEYVVTAIAIVGIPSGSPFIARGTWVSAWLDFVPALSILLAAWILSRWVYGLGPLRSLGAYRARLMGRDLV